MDPLILVYDYNFNLYTFLWFSGAPRAPELALSRGTDSLRVYKLNDILYASCSVNDGRPAANISWFLGKNTLLYVTYLILIKNKYILSIDEEPIYGEELGLPTVRMSQDQLYSKTQNLTRQLRASDNGKSLKCVGIHPGYQNGFSSTEKQLDVKCKQVFLIFQWKKTSFNFFVY